MKHVCFVLPSRGRVLDRSATPPVAWRRYPPWSGRQRLDADASLPEIAKIVLAEGLEVVQEPLYQRRGRRHNTALAPRSSIQVPEQGLPGAVLCGLPVKLRALTGTGKHYDGDRSGDRLRGYLRRLLQVRAAGRQFLGYI